MSAAFPLLILHVAGLAASRPVAFIDTQQILEILNLTLPDASFNTSDQNLLIDTSTFITLKENDWRDAHEGRMIIWSHESQYHPDYGRSFNSRKPNTERHTQSSQFMSFCILGSVIGFILYTYFSHVLLMRKLNREQEASRLRELVHRSALIMAGSAQRNDHQFYERRRSLINMFRAFKL